MNFWTPDTVRAACAGSWVARPPSSDAGGTALERPMAGLSIDSRTVRPGQVFLALRGERHDGHHYLADAVRAGASMLIIDDPSALPAGVAAAGAKGIWAVRVADTRKALLRLAAAYRRTLDSTRVIAVAGSNGKTTTTRLIHAVLSTALRGSASLKSFNNDVGVPLTILAAAPTDQYLICEVGTNAPGEIAQLAGVVEPDIAVITSIGREHLEKLGSVEGVAREEGSILRAVRPGGLAVVTADAPALAEQIRAVRAARKIGVVAFGVSEGADLRLGPVEHVRAGESPALKDGAGEEGVRFTVNGRTAYTVPLLGEHNALNALAAIGVARRFGIPEDHIADALSQAAGPPMRLERVRIGGIDLINDAYNANPDSTNAALRTLAAVAPAVREDGKPGRRIAVLGDMLELGDAAPAAHREIAATVLALGTIDMAVVVGELALFTAERLSKEWPDGRYVLVPDLEAGRARDVAALFRPGDTVLLKGSRRMRLERVVDALRDAHGRTNSPASPASPLSAVVTSPADTVLVSQTCAPRPGMTLH